jgi:hypothetical protein
VVSSFRSSILDFRRRQVQHHDQVLAGGVLELADHQLVVAGRRPPVDPARAVAAAEDAQAVELRLGGRVAAQRLPRPLMHQPGGRQEAAQPRPVQAAQARQHHQGFVRRQRAAAAHQPEGIAADGPQRAPAVAAPVRQRDRRAEAQRFSAGQPGHEPGQIVCRPLVFQDDRGQRGPARVVDLHVHCRRHPGEHRAGDPAAGAQAAERPARQPGVDAPQRGHQARQQQQQVDALVHAHAEHDGRQHQPAPALPRHAERERRGSRIEDRGSRIEACGLSAFYRGAHVCSLDPRSSILDLKRGRACARGSRR